MTQTGDVILRADETSGTLIKLWGKGIKLEDIPSDSLYDVLKIQPARPTISTFQWVKGRQYMTLEDFDLLIGGSKRPKTQAMIERDRARVEQERLARKNTNNSTTSFSNQLAPDSRSGGTFGSIQSGFDSLGQSTQEYMNSLSDMVKDAKSNAVNSSLKSSLKSKFFG